MSPRSRVVAIGRRTQAREVVGQRRGAATKAPRQSRDVSDPALDHERLERKTYLSVAELTIFGSFPSEEATRKWLYRHPQVPRLSASDSGKVLISRRDFENAFQPREEGRHA